MRWLFTMAVILVASSAQADERASVPKAIMERARDALKAGASEEVLSLLANTSLRGQAACLYGQALDQHVNHRTPDDDARVLLYLERCHAATPSAALRKQIRDLQEKLRNAKLGPVALSLRPESAVAKLDRSYSGDTLLADDELWLAFGTYRLEVVAEDHQGGTYALSVSSLDRMLVAIVLPEAKKPVPAEVDLGEDAGADLGQVATATDPRPKKFKTLLAKRYQGPSSASADSPHQTPAQNSKLWPALSAVAATSALGLGVGLQVKDHPSSAIASYGVGTALTGLTLYLLLRNTAPHAAGSRIQVDEDLVSLSYATRF